jgi:FKBP-type peptidyl-prolyl cis-trans isomerase (trigger factor)
VGVDSEIYRLKSKVEAQLEEQGIKFNEMIKNTKELIVDAVKGDIEAGNKLAAILRAEFMNLIEELSDDLQRKLFKFGNRFETYTLSSEAKYSKMLADVKKAVKIAEKVSI